MKITKYYEWLAIQKDNIVRMGLTKEACQELNEIIYIELPTVGTKIVKGNVIAVLETTKSAIDIVSPISGTVYAINEELKHNIAILNKGSLKERWLFDVAVTLFSEYNALKDANIS